MLDKELLEIIGCPLDKAELKYDGNMLVCTECGRVYEVEEGIPVMLIDKDLYRIE